MPIPASCGEHWIPSCRACRKAVASSRCARLGRKGRYGGRGGKEGQSSRAATGCVAIPWVQRRDCFGRKRPRNDSLALPPLHLPPLHFPPLHIPPVSPSASSGPSLEKPCS